MFTHRARKRDEKDKLYDEIGVCDRRCKTCIHAESLTAAVVSCRYILDTGTRRPCPAGKNCTMYDSGKTSRRKGIRLERRNIELVCPRCGKKVLTTAHHKYCDDCAYTVRSEVVKEYQRRRRQEKRQDNMLIDRKCVMCGGIFHCAKAGRELCDECRKIPKKRRAKMRKAMGL